MKSAGSPSRVDLGALLRRLALWAGLGLAGLYLLGVTAGYLYLRYGRDVEAVRLVDVALLRAGELRRTLARQHFRQAQEAWDAKDYQQAYVYFTSAVQRDPGNLPGRLTAARFLDALGATNLEVNLLEDGLARAPENKELNEMLFTRLLSAGRHQEALELLHGRHAAALTGANAAFLQAVELQATLAASGVPASRALLGRRPELKRNRLAVPTVARVLWESGERPVAIEMMAAQVQADPTALPARMILADWLRESGDEAGAIRTALEAMRQFPQEPAARVLLFDVGAARIRGTPDWWREIGGYLKDFNAAPKAVFVLAELAGRRGWIDLSRTLYELAARRGQDLGMLGLFYSDALSRNGQIPAAREVLEQVAQQSDDRSTPFLLQLREREIAAAAATNDRDAVREYARRLAGLLRNDTDLLEQYRRHYQQAGVSAAVTELSDRKPRAGETPPRRG